MNNLLVVKIAKNSLTIIRKDLTQVDALVLLKKLPDTGNEKHAVMTEDHYRNAQELKRA